MTQDLNGIRKRAYPPILTILGLIVDVAASALLAANDFDRRAINWGRMHAALLLALPLLPAIALAAIPKLRSSFIAYVAGIGTVATFVLVLPVGMLIIFIAVATPEQRIDGLALVTYTLAMMMVAVSGGIAYFRLPREERKRMVAVMAMIGAALYAMFGWGFFQTEMRRPYDRAALIRDYNDRQARQTVVAIAECARRQAAIGGQRGYPANMADLFTGGCLPGELERGQSGAAAGADGYAFYYYADPPDLRGHVGRFVACARASQKESGTLAIGIDTDGNVTELGVPAWKPAPICFAAWAGNDDKRYLNALAGCLMSGAALRPGIGFPSTLFNAQGSHAGACDFLALEFGAGGRMRTEWGVVEYRPEPEVGGVIRGYRLVLYPGSGGAPLEMDHMGRIQALPLQNVAPTLEAVESARPAQALKEEGLNAWRRELKAECETGKLSICEDFGDFEWNNDLPDEARRWWDYACEYGRLQSCLLSPRYNPTTDTSEARSYKERCVQGDARYCEKLAELVHLLTPRIEELRKRGGMQTSDGAAARIEAKRRELAPLCEAGNLELCENLGDLEWDVQRPDDARRWWDRACEGGRLQACLMSSRYNPGQDSASAMDLRSRCRQGVPGACSQLEAFVQKLRPRIDILLSKNRPSSVASRPER